MAEQKWHQRYAEGIVIGVLTAGVLTSIGYLDHIASPWFWPLFYGLVASSLFLVVCLAFMILKRIPRSQVIPTAKNIEVCVRTWLDNHKIAVKNDPYPEGFFRFRLTLDGGIELTVLRSRSEQPDYLHISCDLGTRGENLNLLKQFTDDEMTEMLLDIKRELARARVGYSGLVTPPREFHDRSARAYISNTQRVCIHFDDLRRRGGSKPCRQRVFAHEMDEGKASRYAAAG